MKSYDIVAFVNFEARGKNLNSQTVNPILRDFRRKLEAFKVVKGDLVIRVERCDEFESELVDSGWLLASHQVRFLIVDSDKQWANNSNNVVRPAISQGIREIEIQNGLTYTKRITVRVRDVCFQGKPRQGRWATERLNVVTF